MFNWYAFWVYVIVTAVSPGPNNLLSMSNGSQKGLVRALPFNFGIGAGLTVVMIGCAVFCSVLTSVLPKIQLVMRFIGAAYMLYLAWTTFVGDGKMDAEGAAGGFLSGLLLQFVNPKIFVYGIVSLQVYILPTYAGRPWALLGFAALLSAVGFAFTVLWAAFGSAFRRLFAAHAKAVNAVMSLLMVYCAVSLFF